MVDPADASTRFNNFSSRVKDSTRDATRSAMLSDVSHIFSEQSGLVWHTGTKELLRGLDFGFCEGLLILYKDMLVVFMSAYIGSWD